MDNNNNNSLYGIIKQKTIIMKYTILLLSLLSLVCCNTDELTMIQKDPIQNQEISTELESRSMCDLDWTIDYHNNDGDFCTNVLVQINGLTGECADCVIDDYVIVLDPEGTIEDLGPVTVGEYRRFSLPGGVSGYAFVGYESVDWSDIYRANISNFFGIQLGKGEIIDIDFHTDYAEDVPLCVAVTMVCDNMESTFEVCENVSLKCW